MIILILTLFVTATFLRLNSVGMSDRRDAVFSADKAGDPNETRARVYDLQRFSAAHMNASTGVFYLQDQYNRDAQAAIERSSQASSSFATINAEAEAVCHPQFSGWSTAYMQCFLAEVAKHPSTDTLPSFVFPSPELYRYSFVSPLWSPDFAGWSVIVSVVIIVMIIIRMIGIILLRLMLKSHYRDA